MEVKLMQCREFPIMADLSDKLCLLYQQSQADRVNSLTHWSSFTCPSVEKRHLTKQNTIVVKK